MPVRLAPSGPRRMGDEYQDLVALHYLVEMLADHDKYDWVKVEADEGGFLDDVLVKRHDGGVCLYQAKYTSKPESEPLSWALLLHQESGQRGPKRSLLQRWIESYLAWQERKAELGPVEEAGLYSNRRPDAALAALIQDNRLKFDEVPDGPIREKLIKLADGEDQAREFFQAFHWYIATDLTEAGIRRRFESLGGTDSGWISLNRALMTWVCERDQPLPNGLITWQHVQAAAEWHNLKELAQEVAIEQDNYIRRDALVDQVIDMVMALPSGGLRIEAPPGFGKSTFLSTVHDSLEKRKTFVIRHHYALSTTERSGERLSHVRAAESLMKQIQDMRADAISPDRSNRNPSPHDLGRWLDDVSAYCQDRDQKMVVILDGLDHVRRDLSDTAELTALFGHFRPLRKGIVFLFGTQPVRPEWLTEALYDLAPDGQRIELQGLTEDEIARWVLLRRQSLHLGEEPDEEALRALTVALKAKSDGHPLILHYMLGILEGTGLPAEVSLVEALPGTPNRDITVYYASLWRSLPEQAREVLHLLTTCRWEWPAEALLHCLDPHQYRPTTVIEGLQAVSHLLVQGKHGLRALHRSLLLFVSQLPSHVLQEVRLRRLALHWLDQQAPAYLRWQQAWRLQRDLPRGGLVVAAPDWPWLLEALTECYPMHEVSAAFTEAIQDALERRDFGRWAELSLLYEIACTPKSPFDQSTAFLQSRITRDTALEVTERNLDHLSSLDLDDLLIMARYAFERGAESTLQTLLAETWRREAQFPADLVLSDYAARVGALTKQPLVYLAERWAVVGENQEGSRLLLDSFCTELYRQRRLEPAKSLLVASAQAVLGYSASTLRFHLIPLLVELGVDVPVTEPVTDPRAALYLVLSGQQEKVAPVLSLIHPDSFRGNRSDGLHTVQPLWGLMANIALGRDAQNQLWMKQFDSDGPFTPHIGALHRAAQQLVPLLTAPGRVDLFPPLLVDGLNIGNKGFIRIHPALLTLRSLGGEPVTVTVDQLQYARAAGLNLMLWVRGYLWHGRLLLDDRALDWLLTTLEREAFSEESGGLLRLAGELAAMHNRTVDSRRFTELAASVAAAERLARESASLRGMLSVLEHHGNGRVASESWVAAMSPALHQWKSDANFMYGYRIASLFTTVLLTVAPSRLYAFYRWATRAGGNLTNDVMLGLVEQMDLSDPVHCRLAGTATEEAALFGLLGRAEAGDTGSEEALNHADTSVAAVASDRDEETGQKAAYEAAMAAYDYDYDTEQPIGELGRDLTQHPPEPAGLQALMSDAGENDRIVRDWVAHWEAQGRGLDAARALEQSGPPLTPWLARVLFPVQIRSDGPDKAYRTLVMHASESLTEVVGQARRYYRERALDLAADALAVPDSYAHAGSVMEYLYAMDHETEARAVGDATARIWSAVNRSAGIPVPAWVNEPPDEHWALSVLLERMCHADVKVAGRSVRGVAGLLATTDPQTRRLTADRLQDWARPRGAESVSYLPLLVWWAAREMNPELPLPSSADWAALCPYPSLLSMEVERQLGLPQRQPLSGTVLAEDAVPDSFMERTGWLRTFDSSLRERLRAWWYREECWLKADRPELESRTARDSALLRMLARAVGEGCLDHSRALQWAAQMVPAPFVWYLVP